MLIKQEILGVPITHPPEKKKGGEYQFGAHAEKLSRSGNVLMLDIFERNAGEKRFVTNGDSFIFYDYKDGKWNTKSFNGNTRPYYNWSNSDDDEESRKVVLDYLYPGKNHKEHNHQSIAYICHEITTRKEYERRENAKYNKSIRTKNHVAMATPITPEMLKYCKDEIFPQYIFFNKLSDKGRRTGTCSHCGKSFRLPRNTPHKEKSVCPKCGCNAMLFRNQYKSSARHKTLLTVCGSVDKQLIIAVYEISMEFGAGIKPRFIPDLQYVRCYLTGERKQIYSYHYKFNMYYGYQWYEEKWDPTLKTCVFPGNLREVFGNKYYGVDLQDVFEKCAHQVNFIRLLDNLKNFPQAEYLTKIGLVKITSEMTDSDFGNGSKLESVLGISKNLLPLYIKMGVSVYEHRMIEAAQSITEKELKEIRTLKPSGHMYDNLTRIFENVSPAKFMKYLNRQKNCHAGASFEQIITWYKDYLNMLDELDIPLRKNMKTPKDIKVIHDNLSEQLVPIRERREAENFERVTEAIKNLHFSKGGYLIVKPLCRQDFVREGQLLHHCVGGQSYYNGHVSGEKMIFFIRKTDAPDIPLATLQVDMKHQMVIQCYGANDKPPAREIRQFADCFVKYLRKPKREEKGDEQAESL
jgi:hypothetical protein